jgi:hypothetical protein
MVQVEQAVIQVGEAEEFGPDSAKCAANADDWRRVPSIKQLNSSALVFARVEAAGLWGLAIAVLVGAAARFDVRVLSAAGWRILALESYPLGIAAAAALHLWRGSKETTSGESETPGESGETPHAV